MAELTTIVGAAILDDQRRVLGAQRAAPPAMAGWWEFPGGKVESGETDHQALIRECQEELDITIALGDRLGGDVLLPSGTAVLRIWLATVIAGVPRPVEHKELRWLTVEQLDSVPWLPADAPLIEELRALL